ncbi:MAG: ABC transporter permease [Blastochloris sp.]|nr:ABC transporter permease [Blastochloris sp.]
MRTILWKEFREMWVWVLLATLLVAGAFSYGWSVAVNRMFYSNGEAWHSVLHPSVVLVTTFAPMIVGTALGFLQIMPERSRDRWAFLIHRPIRVEQIFWGKILVGLMGYSLAVVLPFAVFSWYCSQPGSVPGPFYWAMTLPGLSSLLCGVSFYMAAIITSLRETRWFGTKAVALVTAAGQIWVVSGVSSFEAALWQILWPSLALFILAHALFVRQDLFDRLKFGGKVASLYVCFVAACTLPPSIKFIHNMFEKNTSGIWYNYEMDREGRILRVEQSDGGAVKIQDLEGNPINFSDDELLNYPGWRADESYFDQAGPPSWRFSYRDPQYHVNELGRDLSHVWFYLKERRVMVAYDRATRRKTVELGRNGKVSVQTGQAEPFESKHISFRDVRTQLAMFDDGARLINVLSGEIRMLYHVTENGGDCIKSGAHLRKSRVETSKDDYYVLLIGRHFHFYDVEAGLKFKVPVDPAWLKADYVNHSGYYASKSKKIGITFEPRWDIPREKRKKMPIYFLVLNEDGSGVQHFELPPLPFVEIKKPWTRHLKWADDYLLKSLHHRAMMYYHARQGRAHEVEAWQKFLQDPAKYYRHLGWLTLAGFLSSLAGWFWIKRYRPTQDRMLLILSLLFLCGPLGLLAMIMALPRHRLKVCPACGSLRPVEKDHCPHCSAPWQTPEKDGTEIFSVQVREERSS